MNHSAIGPNEKHTLLFAPCAYNLAETSRMVEIAKAVQRNPEARRTFAIHFISEGGDFEELIERHGFPLTRMVPRLTKARIVYLMKVDRGEKFAPAFSDSELILRVANEIALLSEMRPVAVLTGSYVTIPVTCRVLRIPVTVQPTEVERWKC